MKIIKPNLFIAGAPKCGTTLIWKYLSMHKNIFLSETKELHYFGGSNVRSTPHVTLDEYLSHFKNASSHHTYIGEASPWYLYSKEAAKNIKEFNPNAKLIIILRDPVDFISSYHQQMLNIGHETISNIEDAIIASDERAKGKNIPKRAHTPDRLLYKNVASYLNGVRYYTDRFSENQLLFLKYEDLLENQNIFFHHIYDFLDIKKVNHHKVKKVNSRSKVNSNLIQNMVYTIHGILKLTGINKITPRGLGKKVNDLNKKRIVKEEINEHKRNHLLNLLDYNIEEVVLLEKLTELNLSDWPSYKLKHT